MSAVPSLRRGREDDAAPSSSLGGHDLSVVPFSAAVDADHDRKKRGWREEGGGGGGTGQDKERSSGGDGEVAVLG